MDKRVTELEIRLTHLEDTIDVLNQTVIKQSDEIEVLQLQIVILNKKIKASQADSPIASESEETLPPHY